MSIPFSTEQFEKKSNRYTPRVKVRLDKVIATQTHLDPAKVQAIARQPAGGTDPMVHPLGGKYYVTDGHHRVAGAIERGDTHIWVKRVR